MCMFAFVGGLWDCPTQFSFPLGPLSTFLAHCKAVFSCSPVSFSNGLMNVCSLYNTVCHMSVECYNTIKVSKPTYVCYCHETHAVNHVHDLSVSVIPKSYSSFLQGLWLCQIFACFQERNKV